MNPLRNDQKGRWVASVHLILFDLMSCCKGKAKESRRFWNSSFSKMTFDEICREYEVTVEDIQVTINYAEDLEEYPPLSVG